MNRRGFLGWLAAAAPIGVFGLPEVKTAPDRPAVLPPGIAPRPQNHYDSLIPEMWAKESLRILEQNMVIGGVFVPDYDHRDISQCNDRIRVGR